MSEGRILTGSAPFPEGASIDVSEHAMDVATRRMNGQAVYADLEVDWHTVTWRILSRDGAPGQKLMVVSARALPKAGSV